MFPGSFDDLSSFSLEGLYTLASGLVRVCTVWGSFFRSLIFTGLLSDLLSFSVFFSLFSEPELDFPAAAAAVI